MRTKRGTLPAIYSFAPHTARSFATDGPKRPSLDVAGPRGHDRNKARQGETREENAEWQRRDLRW